MTTGTNKSRPWSCCSISDIIVLCCGRCSSLFQAISFNLTYENTSMYILHGRVASHDHRAVIPTQYHIHSLRQLLREPQRLGALSCHLRILIPRSTGVKFRIGLPLHLPAGPADLVLECIFPCASCCRNRSTELPERVFRYGRACLSILIVGVQLSTAQETHSLPPPLPPRRPIAITHQDGDCPDIRYQYADSFECGP